MNDDQIEALREIERLHRAACEMAWDGSAEQSYRLGLINRVGLAEIRGMNPWRMGKGCPDAEG